MKWQSIVSQVVLVSIAAATGKHIACHLLSSTWLVRHAQQEADVLIQCRSVISECRSTRGPILSAFWCGHAISSILAKETEAAEEGSNGLQAWQLSTARGALVGREWFIGASRVTWGVPHTQPWVMEPCFCIDKLTQLWLQKFCVLSLYSVSFSIINQGVFPRLSSFPFFFFYWSWGG